MWRANAPADAADPAYRAALAAERAKAAKAATRPSGAGFATFELQVMDPEIDYPMSSEMQSKVEAARGYPLKQVWARYERHRRSGRRLTSRQ